MATRNGKSRKEIYFTSQERIELQILARRFSIDQTSMLRIVIRLGIEALPPSPHNVANGISTAQSVTIEQR